MNRRTFLGAGAVGTAAVSGMVTPRDARPRGSSRTGPAPIPNMDAYVARVDAGMARIREWSTEKDLAGAAVQSLYMTAMFGDLPMGGQLHPGMQDRMWAALPVMNDATEQMQTFLAAQTPEQLEAVRRVLRQPDDPGGRITEALVREAELSGVSEVRQRQLRVLMNRALWRLKHQPPTLVVDEYLDKVRRLTDSDLDSAARQRWLASRVAEQLFWDERFRKADPDQVLLAIEALHQRQNTRKRSKRDARLIRGARTMGIGVLAGALSAALIASDSDSAVGAGAVIGTVGAIFFLVGLIILLVGLATPHEKPQPVDSLPRADSLPAS